MTGPGRDDTWDTLAAALADVELGPEDGPGWNHVVAAELTPVVRRIAADELRAAAAQIADIDPRAALWLTTRADALEQR